MPADLDAARYVSFTSYKKDGSRVSLPVWIVPFDGGYAFTTDQTSYKVRRIANDPRATLRVCNARGRVSEGAVEHVGAAIVLDPEKATLVSDLVKNKYRIGWAMLSILAVARKLTRDSSSTAGDCAIKVTLHS